MRQSEKLINLIGRWRYEHPDMNQGLSWMRLQGEILKELELK